MVAMHALPLLPFIIASCDAFSPSYRVTSTTRLLQPTKITSPPQFRLHIATRDQDATASSVDDENDVPNLSLDPSPLQSIRLEVCASSGIQCESDLPRVLETVASVCEDYGIPLDASNIRCDAGSTIPSYRSSSEMMLGVLGRVLLIRVRGLPSEESDLDENEIVAQLKIDMSERMDAMLMSMHVSDGSDVSDHNEASLNSNQPILLAFQSDNTTTIQDAIEKEISDYGLRDGVDDVCSVDEEDESSPACFVHPMRFEINCYPSSVVEIDGAMIDSVQSPGQTHFDTSSILVFDKLLDEDLRKRLLNVVKGYPEDHSIDEDDNWNDIENGPDPTRWVRGGITDVASDDADDAEGGSCWGLADDAIMDICYGEHPAVSEFESKLANLFPNFVVSRLPEAVLGGCISPLTANAPTHGDSFDYHIDADPLQVPPSPWADVYGRYPNRSKGKPRFVSCLLYLNDIWDAETWGGPTRFLDPPTQEVYDVMPKPGRCVIMDQDVSHTVVAPNEEAGSRPRYSLVWKLILHPTEEGQGMDLACGRKGLWPDPLVVGSAKEVPLL